MVLLKLSQGFLGVEDKISYFLRVLVIIEFGFESSICKGVVENQLPVL